MNTLAASFLPGIGYLCLGLCALLLGLCAYTLWQFHRIGHDLDEDRK